MSGIPRFCMDDRCKYLEYRQEASSGRFDTERAYCTAVEQFVQPMRADICNYRYGLSPERNCEYYEAAESSDTDQGGETVRK